MNLLEKFIQLKETHMLEHYADVDEDGDLYVEFGQGDSVRRYKIHAIREWLHLKCQEGDDCACQHLDELDAWSRSRS